MNIGTFTGRIGRDAEHRTTPSGKDVVNFSLAVDERRGGEKTTLRHAARRVLARQSRRRRNAAAVTSFAGRYPITTRG